MKNKKIYRSTDDRLVAGIIGGFAEYFNFDSTILRIIFAVFFVGSVGTLSVLYAVLWFVIPVNPGTTHHFHESDVNDDNGEN